TYDWYSYSYYRYTYSWYVYDADTVLVTNRYDHVMWSGNYYDGTDTLGDANAMDGSVTLGGGSTYVGGDATRVISKGFTAPSILKIATGAKLNLYVGGGTETNVSVSLSGNQTVNMDGFAQSLVVYCADNVNSVTLSGNAGFTGIIVAPNADFTFNGGGS